ncbi:hypothetical protein D9M68_311220 [compost metagenome]
MSSKRLNYYQAAPQAMKAMLGLEKAYEEVAAHFSDQELAELTFVIAAINAWNRFGVGFGMQPE